MHGLPQRVCVRRSAATHMCEVQPVPCSLVWVRFLVAAWEGGKGGPTGQLSCGGGLKTISWHGWSSQSPTRLPVMAAPPNPPRLQP